MQTCLGGEASRRTLAEMAGSGPTSPSRSLTSSTLTSIGLQVDGETGTRSTLDAGGDGDEEDERMVV